MRRGVPTAVVVASLLAPAPARASELPTHDPLSILVVSDGVNPHGLPPDQLTEPGDLSAALSGPGTGLSLSGTVDEVDSQCVDAALDRLTGSSPPDVVIYFAHRSAQRCGGTDAQVELTAGIQAQLDAGRGVVVFHHGAYADVGKEPLLDLVGVTSSSIDWAPTEGQRVIVVDEAHFVSTHALSYADTTTYANPTNGIANGAYPSFTNVPDERYPATVWNTSAGQRRTALFESDDAGARSLGYALEHDDWPGRVVFYQPGEVQPQAFDPAGRNLQILVNAIYWAAGNDGGGDGDGDGTGDGGGTGDGDGTSDGGASDGGTSDGGTGGDDAGTETGGDTSDGGPAPAAGGCTLAPRPDPIAGLVVLLAWRRRSRRRALTTAGPKSPR